MGVLRRKGDGTMNQSMDQEGTRSPPEADRPGAESLEGERPAGTGTTDAWEVEVVSPPSTQEVPEHTSAAPTPVIAHMRRRASRVAIPVAILGVVAIALVRLVPRRRWEQLPEQSRDWARRLVGQVSRPPPKPTRQQLVQDRVQQMLEANRATVIAGALAIALAITGPLLDRRRARQ
jgi:hypothetical protein